MRCDDGYGGYGGRTHCQEYCRKARYHDGAHDCMRHAREPKKPPPRPQPIRVRHSGDGGWLTNPCHMSSTVLAEKGEMVAIETGEVEPDEAGKGKVSPGSGRAHDAKRCGTGWGAESLTLASCPVPRRTISRKVIDDQVM